MLIEAITHWVGTSVEAQQWGEIVTRVSFFATLFFTCSIMYGLWKQRGIIRKSHSAKAVSLKMFTYMMWLYFAFGYYGWTKHSISSTFNGACGFFYLLVLWEFAKYGKSTPTDRVVMIMSPLMLAIMLLTPWKETAITLFLLGSTTFMVDQLQQIRRDKNAGSVSGMYIVSFLTSTMFWTVFAYKTGQVALLIVNPFVLVIMVAIVYAWWQYRDRPVTTAQVST
jgi:uncharacterized protein with PQ loop repeat